MGLTKQRKPSGSENRESGKPDQLDAVETNFHAWDLVFDAQFLEDLTH